METKSTLIQKSILDRIIDQNQKYLVQCVNTKQAAMITGVPENTLITLRSRGGGPLFLQPKNTRIVRYLILHLIEWMLSGGIKSNTVDCSNSTPLLGISIGCLSSSVKSRTGE